MRVHHRLRRVSLANSWKALAWMIATLLMGAGTSFAHHPDPKGYPFSPNSPDTTVHGDRHGLPDPTVIRPQHPDQHPKAPPEPEAPPDSATALAPHAHRLAIDTIDSDGDGMTDSAERKYGFDPYDPQSFPQPPAPVEDHTYQLPQSGIGAWYVADTMGITIKWQEPDSNADYSLELYNGAQTIYYGGHYDTYAPVNYLEFNLTGTEILRGSFTEYNADRQWVRDFPAFTIDLSQIVLPDIIGNPANRMSYSFVDFSAENELSYRNFLQRLWPLLEYYLGPPAESFNCEIVDLGYDSGYFMVVDNGRTMLTDGDFIPRLIAHELVHAWKGHFAFSSDSNWEYDPLLTGFEEATAEGMAFELMHEYVRSYPYDNASRQLLDWKPYQYWSYATTFYDSIKFNAMTYGEFWDITASVKYKYSIAATTWQSMLLENPDVYKEVMSKYYQRINNDPSWRPNRDDLIDIWAHAVPSLFGMDLRSYLDALPVFHESRYPEGMHVLSSIRPYGSYGDQQFAVTYANKDGEGWWGIEKERLDEYNLPAWIDWMDDDPPDDLVFINTQGQPFTIRITDYQGRLVHQQNAATKIQTGYILGFGWDTIDEIEMDKFPVGFYLENVTFTNYIAHTPSASDDFYFFGVQDLNQDKYIEYVIIVGVDGVREGTATITIQGADYTKEIINGVAVFRSIYWPLNMEGKCKVVITNNDGVAHEYLRYILLAGTYWEYYQHQFIIVDRNFNGVEDHFEGGPFPPPPPPDRPVLAPIYLLLGD
jgi:hypothetical protein